MRRSRSSDGAAAGAAMGAPARGAGLVARQRAMAMALRAAILAAAPACGAAVASPVSRAPASCPAQPVVLARQADVARLAGCTTARGVTIRSGAALDLAALGALTAITGDLVIGPTVAIEDITLGELRVVDGAIRVIGNGLLRGLYLPRLERAGAVDIDGNASIATIALPRLEAVHGALRITDDASLELLDLSALASVDGALVLAGAPGLTLVEAASSSAPRRSRSTRRSCRPRSPTGCARAAPVLDGGAVIAVGERADRRLREAIVVAIAIATGAPSPPRLLS